MYRFFVAAQDGMNLRLSPDTEHHIVDVLRLPWGTQVEAVTPSGTLWLAEVTGSLQEGTRLHALEKLNVEREPHVRLALAQGIAKGDKMDFIVQKAVELGVRDIYPLALETCVVKLTGDKALARVERWQKIAAAAAQQSRRDIVPHIHHVMTLDELLRTAPHKLRLVAYEDERKCGLRTVLTEHLPLEDVLMLIGPEGGLTSGEVARSRDAGMLCVSLGARILRVETAGVAALSAILYANGDLGG